MQEEGLVGGCIVHAAVYCHINMFMPRLRMHVPGLQKVHVRMTYTVVSRVCMCVRAEGVVSSAHAESERKVKVEVKGNHPQSILPHSKNDA